jgi:hypothetical protein
LRTSPFAIAPVISWQVQPYLQSVYATDERWWQLYTLTDAAGKQRQVQATTPLFDFGLMVQAIDQRPPQVLLVGRPSASSVIN